MLAPVLGDAASDFNPIVAGIYDRDGHPKDRMLGTVKEVEA